MLLYTSRQGSGKRNPGVAKFGIALEWGSRGLEFESRHSDQRPKEHCSFGLFSILGIQMCSDFEVSVLKHTEAAKTEKQETDSEKWESIIYDRGDSARHGEKEQIAEKYIQRIQKSYTPTETAE